MITKTQNNPTFGAKLTQNAANIIKNNRTSINAQSKRVLRSMKQDVNTNAATIDIITKKCFGRDIFSFAISPDPKSVARLTPHHPVFISDAKSPTGIKIAPKRNFYWKNLDEMLQNDILSPTKLKKIITTWNERRLSLDKWLKPGKSNEKTYKYAGITGCKTAELIHLTQVKK